MKTFSNYIHSLLILFSILWLSGCAEDSSILAPDAAQGGNGDVILSLNVSISNSQGGTRAFESTENPLELMHSLRVIIVNEKDTVEHNLRVDMPEGMGVDKVGELQFKVSTKYGTTTISDKNQLIQTEKKRIYLIANEDAIPSGSDLPTGMVDIRKFLNEDLKPGANFLQSSAKYIVIWNNWQVGSGNAPTLPEYATPFIDNEGDNKKYVLMSEFFDVDVTANLSVGGDQTTKANLFITRNLVKFRFSIKADDDTPSFKVKKIIFSNLMQKEYLFPNDAVYNPAKYDADGKVSIEDREITSYVVPSYSHGDGNLVRPYIFEPENFGFNATSAAPGSAFTNLYEPQLYFCETKHLVKSDTDDTITDSQLYTVAIEVEFQNKLKDEEGNEVIDPFVVTFDAQPLKDLTLLPRNTIVKVDMNVHKGKLEATATVFPYTGVWLNPAFGFNIPVTSVTISERSEDTGDLVPITSKELRVGESTDLIGTVKPDNANNQDLVWLSSDTTLVSVSKIGKVTAKALPAGAEEATVDITAMAADGGGASATCKITVKPKIAVESISLSPSSWTGSIGSTTTLTPTFTPGDATVQDVIWSSDKPEVATVSSYGVVKAIGPGTAVITATAKDNTAVTAPCSVTVSNIIPVSSVSISAGPTGTFYVGQQFSFNATIAPNNATNQSIKWTSSDNSIATVNDYGLVTAVNEGEVTITATAADDKEKKASRTFIITKPVPVTGIEIVKSNKVLTSWTSGDPTDIRARIIPSDATFKSVTWSSSDESVAKLELSRIDTSSTDPVNYGTAIFIVKPGKRGTATIKITSVANPEVSTTLPVTVN